MITIAITGASGNMGIEAVNELLKLGNDYRLKLLVYKDRSARRLIKRVKNCNNVSIIYGDVRNYEDCKNLATHSDYVIHMAAIIPPKSDEDRNLTFEVNYGGTVNIINAISECQKLENNVKKFVHVSSVAIYGNRDFSHPYGRVGDPVMPSIFDYYASSKALAERSVIDSGLPKWVVLRQTGILHDRLFFDNVKNGITFHTPWDCPIEWVTASDSGLMIANLIKKDTHSEINDFWRRIFNVGGGENCREIGYDVFRHGFGLMGGKVEDYFLPYWNNDKNFHCFWFLDSQELNQKLDFWRTSCDDFWSDFGKKYPQFHFAKILPKSIIKNLILRPLSLTKNAPYRWLKDNNEARIKAFFYDVDSQKEKSWDAILTHIYNADFVKNTAKNNLLSHGFDSTKSDGDITIEDCINVANFRGGKVISPSLGDDIYTPIEWECHDGHRFKASPFLILRGGYWCSECCMPTRIWNYDNLSKKIPYYSQVWLDTHNASDNYVYYLDEKEMVRRA